MPGQAIQNNLEINEIFSSIQGEGYWTGVPCTFIRFAGCNLNCVWCDSKYAIEANLSISAENLIDKFMKMKNLMSHIVLTGGEPTIQNPVEMKKFILFLKDAKFSIQVESNGILIPPWVAYCEWITVSPKRGTDFRLGHANEVKVVYDDHSNQELKYFEHSAFKYGFHLFLQPKSNLPVEIKKCVKLVKKRTLWRLSLQTQKIIDIK